MRPNRSDAILAASLVAGLLAAACSRENRTPPPERRMAEANPGGRDTSSAETAPKPVVSFDLQFIDTMSRHHQDAIAMGQLAAARAAHPELKEFGPKLAAEQERQMKLMADWRNEWYTGAANAENRRMDGMSRLNPATLDSVSGEAFDRRFLELLIPHHQGAVVMATMGLGKAEHPELKALSQQIVDVHQREVDMMMKWKSAWGLAP